MPFQSLTSNNNSGSYDMDKSRERYIIFISHATPEDNDFTIWLASRLKADGFDVWIDKQALLGGEKFWQEIDQVIRHKAIKFLLVYSENICIQKQRGILKDGVEKEKSLAESIAKANNLKDFIILMNIDGSEYNLFIGADTLNQISFHENWASGYSQLLKKFKKDEVKPYSTVTDNFSRWYEEEYIINSGIKQLPEIYYDSWWPIPELPQSFYVYLFPSENVAAQVQKQTQYPTGRISNIIITFYDTPGFENVVDGKTEKIYFSDKYEIRVADVLLGVHRDGFPSTRDVENYLKTLLQRIFHLFMKERGLRWYNMANKKQAYYFTGKSTRKIKFEYYLRSSKTKKRKSISGRYLSNFWHFAISARPVLNPQLAFSLKSHLVFTTNGYNLWDDVDKMHAARRKKGRLMFNEDWRDMLFAFLHAVYQRDESLKTRLSPSFVLQLRPWTNIYKSEFGYTEPKEKNRHNILEAEYEYHEREDDSDPLEEIDV